MKLEIQSAGNGWIVTCKTGSPEDQDEIMVFEGADNCEVDPNQDVDKFADLLWYVSAQMGPSTGRYSPKRIKISVEPGDKYEDGVKD